MRPALPRPNRPSPRTRPRRGVTLVEMLVVVALVVLMMTILVQIFQSATGAMSASRTVQELDANLRQVDLRLRSDLGGCTARFTPPLDPLAKLGYFEYGENALADAQGEDTDDYLAFTTKAPEGQVFTGRVWLSPASSPNRAVQPVTITSQLAEVIYFLRNGNLYRRVFLIVPERAGSLSIGPGPFSFPALGPAATVSFVGVNDVSMHPIPTGVAVGFPAVSAVPNDLGDLTNRENRAFRPRFRNDFFPNGSFGSGTPDGKPDDFNGDDNNDFYPTLYPNVFSYQGSAGVPGMINETPYPSGSDPRTFASSANMYDVYAFPYIYPGMYSQPDTASTGGFGWVHSLDPSGTTYVNGAGASVPPPIGTGNHAPLPGGDNLPVPVNNPTGGQAQTWWGFPTWRETLSSNWGDPILSLGNGAQQGYLFQANGLRPFPPGTSPAAAQGTAAYKSNLLPPVTNQYGSDQAGSTGAGSFGTFVGSPGVWDDDLILSNVRSFDVKAYDPDAPRYSNAGASFFPSAGYYDLGYGVVGNNSKLKLSGLSLDTTTPQALWDSATSQPLGFLHAGRMPPLGGPILTGTNMTGPGGDNRVNPSRPFNPFNGFDNMNYVGDNGTGVIRLTRVWDTWSTDYANAPALDIFQNGLPNSSQPMPVFPSYPAPYASPLRGIQIQIRVADPRGERVKVLTIRQDFTDKL